MSNHQEDLDLLLSLQDRVLETPPASPGRIHSYSPDDGSPKRTGQADMSVFRDAVQDCLDYEPQPAPKHGKSKPSSNSSDPTVEKFSGLRIRNQVVSPADLSTHFSDIRFVRLHAIKNLLIGDPFLGCWATVGVLTEKGNPKMSSIGKNYSIWKFGCLDEDTVSVFLFGDAYQMNWKEQAGTVFALFNCKVRKDTSGTNYSLSAFSANQVLKIGLSADYGVCKGKTRDGLACTLVINKRRGIYCRYHRSKASEKYSITRNELKGGNLRTAFRDNRKSEGIYLIDPLVDKAKLPTQPMKLLSVDGLKKALSNAGKVTSNIRSQGIRFLAEITGESDKKVANKGPSMEIGSKKRLSSTSTMKAGEITRSGPDTKREKVEHVHGSGARTNQPMEKMIELDLVSSDEEM